jgi:hypothetical protein
VSELLALRAWKLLGTLLASVALSPSSLALHSLLWISIVLRPFVVSAVTASHCLCPWPICGTLQPPS